MKKLLTILLSIFLLFSLAPQSLFAEESASYDDIKFPQWAKDLRRTEIITFGSLPFVTLWTTLGYSLAAYGEFRNPMDKSTDSFTEDDQWNIIKISTATCFGLGLVDLTVNLILRAHKESKIKKMQKMRAYTVMSESQIQNERPRIKEESDEEAIKRIKKELEMESRPRSEEMLEGVESALF